MLESSIKTAVLIVARPISGLISNSKIAAGLSDVRQECVAYGPPRTSNCSSFRIVLSLSSAG